MADDAPHWAKVWAELRPRMATWPEDMRDEWEERAALVQYLAKVPREQAEFYAYSMVAQAAAHRAWRAKKAERARPWLPPK